VLTFEDIAGFPDKDTQVVIRSISIEDIAKAVYKVDPQIVNKFFTNMSAGTVNAIKEIMEYAGELTPVQVDEAQMKVLDAVKRLEVEGKISVRQQSSQEIDIIDGSDLSSEAQRMAKFQNISKKPEEPAAAAPEQEENLQDTTDWKEVSRIANEIRNKINEGPMPTKEEMNKLVADLSTAYSGLAGKKEFNPQAENFVDEMNDKLSKKDPGYKLKYAGENVFSVD